ncbi:MAG TPA: DUF2182 domain-containing protein [Burkholderiaceae bacterium]
MNAADRARHRRVFAPVLLALVAWAWAALAAWSYSPYARWLAHDEWTRSGPAAELCRVLPGGSVLVPAAVAGAAWVLMILAMMLPTTLPLVGAFERVVSARPDRGRMLALLLLGYGVAWGAFGLLAHGLHEALLAAAARVPGLAWHGAWIGAAVLALAGAFQFSSLKRRCLDKCRTPISFVTAHWRGRAPGRQAFRLGLHHGLFCVGCCWALMLLMFLLGMGSLGWMALLGALMAVEKNVTWGRRLSAPLGWALLAAAAALAVSSA